jgi:hypothetical protein
MILEGDSGPTKYCPDCRKDLPTTEFTRNRQSRAGRSFYRAACARARVLASRRRRLGPPRTRNGHCKPCHNRIVREDKELHGGARNHHLRHRYAITAEHFDGAPGQFRDRRDLMLRAVAYLGRDLSTPVDELPTFALGVVLGPTESPRPPGEPEAA